MMRMKCSRCPHEHDLSHMEPSFALPGCIAAMSTEERAKRRVVISNDVCSIRDEGPGFTHGFVRVLLPIPIHGDVPCNWGVWVEPSHSDFEDILDAWTSPLRLTLKRPALLANQLATYSETLGLPGIVSFPDLKSIGRFELLHDIERDAMHSLVSDQRSGVTPARKLEWLLSAIHPDDEAN